VDLGSLCHAAHHHLPQEGGVAKGEGYIKTTVLVDTGIYAIVRHPQGGTAWLLINLGVVLRSSRERPG
jgi:protein-S-isoprenylcysteine O-methyltransferase Ste14